MSTGSIDRSDIPPIYVSEPKYDDMGAILDRLEVDHSPVRPLDLSRQNRGIVLLNCSFSWDDEVNMDALATFVERGNTLMASDLASRSFSHFTDATFGSGNWGDEVRATVVNSELANLLGQEHLTLNFDTAINEPDRLPDGAEPLLRAQDRDSVIAYKFSHGSGNIVYTTFHNHSQSSEIEDALLQVLLMVPIAESTNTTVTDTYTTVVGGDDDFEDDATGSDTQMIDPESGDTTQIYDETGDHTEKAVNSHDTAAKIYLTARDGGRGSITREIAVGESVRLGRDDFESIVDEKPLSYISGQHLKLRNDEGTPPDTLTIRDTNSTNGTRLGDRDITDGDRHTLEHGNFLTLADGRVTLVVQYD